LAVPLRRQEDSVFKFKVPVFGRHPVIPLWPGMPSRRVTAAPSAAGLQLFLRGTAGIAAIIAVGSGLSGCVTSSRGGAAQPNVSVARLSGPPASSVDPLLAAPPTTTGDSGGSQRVPPGTLAPPASNGSQRVPLGALTPGAGVGQAGANTAPPVATSPPLLIAPKALAPASQPPTAMAMAAPMPPTAVSPAPRLSKPATAAPASSAAVSTTAAATPSAPSKSSKFHLFGFMKGGTKASPAAPVTEAAIPPATAVPPSKLQLPVAPAHPDQMATKAQPRTSDSDETVVISSATPVPIEKSREFIPALLSVSARTSEAPSATALGAVINQPMTAAEKNVAQRFEVLKRLLDEGLITPEEYTRHRNANLGALLPFTHDPGAFGLERPSADADAIVARLEALRRALEMRAISADQHASERAMILSALLPTMPDERAEGPLPPENVIEGAARVAHLQTYKNHGLITADEFDGERKAIDQYLRTGSFGPTAAAVASTNAAKSEKDSKKAAADSVKADEAAASKTSDVGEITGPVLHLASFRTKDAAERGWQEALAQNKSILGNYHEIIRKIDLGEGKGIFFRLMAGPFASIADAEGTCIKLKANSQFCRASADGS